MSIKVKPKTLMVDIDIEPFPLERQNPSAKRKSLTVSRSLASTKPSLQE